RRRAPNLSLAWLTASGYPRPPAPEPIGGALPRRAAADRAANRGARSVRRAGERLLELSRYRVQAGRYPAHPQPRHPARPYRLRGLAGARAQAPPASPLALPAEQPPIAGRLRRPLRRHRNRQPGRHHGAGRQAGDADGGLLARVSRPGARGRVADRWGRGKRAPSPARTGPPPAATPPRRDEGRPSAGRPDGHGGRNRTARQWTATPSWWLPR